MTQGCRETIIHDISKKKRLTIYITVTDGNHGDGFGEGLAMEHGRTVACH